MTKGAAIKAVRVGGGGGWDGKAKIGQEGA